NDLDIETQELTDADVAAIESAGAEPAAGSTAAAAPAAPAAPAASPAPAQPDYITELKRLAELRDMGIITAEDFEAKKNQLLGL
ncbi:MAG TPA: SHOCT domain-containing protein, partial [Promineifilum sp.]|nr:SHOCT domain-containing protein [Promineifilum sp.]